MIRSMIAFAVFVCCVSSCCNISKLNETKPIDSGIWAEYNGYEIEQVPFVHQIGDRKSAEIYNTSIAAVKISSIIVDDQLLEGASVFVDDLDCRSHRPRNNVQIYLMSLNGLLSLTELSSNDYTIIQYDLPKDYRKAIITYQTRDAKGISDVKNSVTLYREGKVPGAEERFRSLLNEVSEGSSKATYDNRTNEY